MGAATLPALARPALDALSDETLCDRIAGEDEVAFEILFHRHERGLLSFCRHMLRSLHEAEEVVQHTFISAYNQIRGGDAPEHCKAWLYAVARNRCISILRTLPEQVPDDSEPETEGLDDEVERRSELRALLGEVERLPPDQRAALVLFELVDLSHAQIAEVLAVEPPKVKALVFQARSTLMSYREAREVPCAAIRRQLSVLCGGALNRRPLKHHLELCPACTEFRQELRL
jgi:RNA polymerase sigma factor (sigma-70 family)